jgi:hypothetical protein
MSAFSRQFWKIKSRAMELVGRGEAAAGPPGCSCDPQHPGCSCTTARRAAAPQRLPRASALAAPPLLTAPPPACPPRRPCPCCPGAVRARRLLLQPVRRGRRRGAARGAQHLRQAHAQHVEGAAAAASAYSRGEGRVGCRPLGPPATVPAPGSRLALVILDPPLCLPITTATTTGGLHQGGVPAVGGQGAGAGLRGGARGGAARQQQVGLPARGPGAGCQLAGLGPSLLTPLRCAARSPLQGRGRQHPAQEAGGGVPPRHRSGQQHVRGARPAGRPASMAAPNLG